MGVIATGVNKILSFKRQAAGLGDITTSAISGGQNLRRVSSTVDLKKATYSSKEIIASQQVRDMRHGVRSVDGSISGELSVGTYQKFIESICRQNAQTAVTLTSATNDIVVAVTTGTFGTITTTAANFLTSGFKVGMVIRGTGFTAPATANNGKNFLITAIAANGKQMTVTTLDDSLVVAKTETAAVTLTEAGKHTFVPQSGQTRDYYTIEHFYSDINQSELFTDCVISQMDVKLPASGMAGIDFQIKGLDMVPGTAQAFASPSASSTGSSLAAANGALFLAGVPVGLITGMNFSVKGGYTTIGGVVGQNTEPDIFPGTVTVDGQATVLFQNATVRDYFVNETEVAIVAVFTTANTPGADFQAFVFPRVKMGGASKDDGEKGLVMTMPFTALENVAGGTGKDSHATTFYIQDSQFV